MLTLDHLIEQEVTPWEPARAAVWDALWNHRSIGRIAVRVRPSEAHIESAKRVLSELRFPEPVTSRATSDWSSLLLGDLAVWLSGWQTPGDAFPSLNVPRSVHGQSQGICDLFGARVEPQPDGNVYVYPLAEDPDRIATIQPRPLETSMYWGAVEYVRYARSATAGRLPVRGPIMTGPFDTANYLLGTMTLMEWVYTEPQALNVLLDRITEVIAGMVMAVREAAGGSLHAHHLGCMRGGHDFASECRSLVSEEIYERFEAPRLRRLGETLGPYAIHSCGNWERTIASARRDPSLRAMNGQVKENDLADLCACAGDGLALSIQSSENLAERYTFASREEYFVYVLSRAPAGQLLEVTIAEEEVPRWNQACIDAGRAVDAVVG